MFREGTYLKIIDRDVFNPLEKRFTILPPMGEHNVSLKFLDFFLNMFKVEPGGY